MGEGNILINQMAASLQNQVSLAMASLLSSHLQRKRLFFLTVSPANLLASFLWLGQMGAARGGRGDAAPLGEERCRHGTNARAGRDGGGPGQAGLGVPPRRFPAPGCPHLQLGLLWQLLYKQSGCWDNEVFTSWE